MNELPATVYILDRPYKLKISAADERFLRRAAELIDAQAKGYGEKYVHQDRQDLLAMTALTQITQLLKQADRLQRQEESVVAGLGKIDKLLASVR